jgi:hypothetical protein
MSKIFQLLAIIHSQLLIVNCFSQGIDRTWYLGYTYDLVGTQIAGTKIVFDTNDSALVSLHYNDMRISATNTSISDSLGNTLFYTNGVYVANKLDQQMTHGDSLSPGSLTAIYTDLGLGIGEPLFGQDEDKPFASVRYACQYIQNNLAERAPAAIFVKSGVYF